jgi:hypothetical protein
MSSIGDHCHPAQLFARLRLIHLSEANLGTHYHWSAQLPSSKTVSLFARIEEKKVRKSESSLL